jgi:uncharacterized protein YjiS (DUF1127 family)
MNATLNLRSVAATTRGLLVDSLAAGIMRLASRFLRARLHQALEAGELQAMSDLELKDLGIGRSEIPHALHGRGGGF